MESLMPLPKGKTNNPHGRPKKDTSLTEVLSKYGNKRIKLPEHLKENEELKELEGMKCKDALAKKLWQLAVYKNEITAIKYIFDRIDGKPINTIVTGNDIGNISFITAVQKELFNEDDLEGAQDEGTLEPPEETSASAGE